MAKKDGKTSENRGKEKRATTGGDQVISAPLDRGQRVINNEGAGIGIQGYNRNDQGDSSGTDRGKFRRQPDEPSVGKVLEQLTSIEDRFYRYVHAHQERLDKRQQESKRAEDEFRAEIESLKEQIRRLVSANNDVQQDE